MDRMHPKLAALSLALVACARAPAPREAKLPPPIRREVAEPDVLDGPMRAAWARAGVVPAPRADDATYLRRVYVDLVGTVPGPDETRAFLTDVAPDKRRRLVDRLLASDGYAKHWTAYWEDVLIGSAKAGLVDRAAFRGWLGARFAENTPWDRVVAELLTATGTNGGEQDANGAVNWTLRYEASPQDLGGHAARVFLGAQIQCAQCHDHKTESWKQDDFRRFTSAFLHARVDPLDHDKKMGVRRVALLDAASAPPRFAKNAELAPIVRTRATALDGTDLERGKDTRKALAAWMTSKDNPMFARAFVNRMWGHFLGRGFYDPVDDIRPSNAPTAPEILDRLAADFVAHGFDVKHLLRVICAAEVYQLAASAEAKTDPEDALWGRFHVAPLGPEELLSAILRGTDLEAAAERAGIKNVDTLRASLQRKYAFLFDVDEENDEPAYSGTVSQALALLNGALVAQGTRAHPGSAVRALVEGPGDDRDKVEALVVRVLARPPTAAERARFVEYVGGHSPPSDDVKVNDKTKRRGDPLERLDRGRTLAKAAAYEDLFWALLNSSEFTFNH